LDYEELSSTLHEALESIPAESRDVLSLWMTGSMDYAAIAQVLNIPVGTVRSRLNRTRRALREALES
jgi:RNA polymerase sigma-70 factor (ECF subfamily)